MRDAGVDCVSPTKQSVEASVCSVIVNTIGNNSESYLGHSFENSHPHALDVLYGARLEPRGLY